MKKNYYLILMALFFVSFSGYGQVSDLIISEYGEGSSGNSKYIEIYNGTGATVDMSNYELWRISNGGAWPEFTLSLSGNLLNGATYVVANNVTDVPGADLYNSGFCSWNGDDAVGIAKDIASTFTLIDAVGTNGSDPGTHWTVGTSGETRNDRLVRKATVCDPNTNWSTSSGVDDASSEWTYSAYSSGSANAGHTVTCVATTTVGLASSTYTIGENNASVDICVNIINESSTNATNVDLVLTSGNAPHLTYTTQTITFPAGSSSQQCATINIAQNTNCGDTTSYTFELQNESGGDSVSISTNSTTSLTVNDDDGAIGPFRTLSFESGDDWGYTPVGGGVNSISNKFFGTQSYELSGNNRVLTDNVDISTYTNVTLSVAFAAAGPDSGDDLNLEISYDNGANWFAANRTKLVDGFGDADIDIGTTNALNPTTVSANPWTVSIPATETQIRVRLRAIGLETNDFYYVDDIILSGDTCISVCTPTHTVTGFTPTSGPTGTEVTITGTGFTALTEVEFDGIDATTITFIDANTLIATVPSGASTDAITVTENSCDIDSATDFTVTLNNGNCGSLNDLIMTEIYDHSSGSLGYIEVYNGTGAPINLTNYFIRRYGSNANYLANDYTDYTFAPSATIIADGAVIYGKISSDADVATPDFSFGNAGFSGINGDDIFELRDNTGVIDVYQVPNSNVGYTALRSVNTAGPNSASPGGNPSDWSHSTTENTADLGLFPYVGLSNFPVVDTSPSDVTMCSAQAVFDASATPGASGTLTYQWYYNEGNGIATDWTVVSAGDFPLTTVSGESTNQLILGYGFANYNNYQFYCLVTEDGSCSTASDAAQIKLDVAIWSSSGWSSAPTIDKMVIIDHPYDTDIDGSFQACQLTVNSSNLLDLRNNTFVEVENDVIVNGNIIVETSGSFVQNNDLASTRGAVTTPGNKDRIQVKKQTAILNSYQEYTYWSSPVIGETIQDGLDEASDIRRFYFDARNYNDSCAESSNDNNLVCDDGMGGTLQDDIDDEGDDWNYAAAASVMQPGVGYASTHASVGYINPARYEYIFEGPFNNGEYLVPIYRNDSELADNNWNFIGNPYPSAVSIIDFLTANTNFIDQNAGSGAITGALFFWSHNTAADGSTNGNETQNYSQGDYAIYNGAGGRVGGDGVTPDPYIPSGQGFFVSMSNSSPSTSVSGYPNVETTNVVFNNSMRVTANNAQFFRVNEAFENERIWLNLTTDNGVFNQLLVAYIDGATDAEDGMFYDAYNLSSNMNASLHSLIVGSDKRFAIQGKSPSSLSMDEVIPLGFYNTIDEATLYKISIAQLEGEFMTGNHVFIKDNLMNIVHNLSEDDYSFTSDPGEFNNRFEIVFQPEALSIIENEIDPNGLTIVELSDGNVKFSVGQQLTITQVDILDIIGRIIYQFKGDTNEEVYNLSRLSQSAYIAKVKLSNGQLITKKALKSN